MTKILHHDRFEIAQASRNFGLIMSYRKLVQFVRVVDVLPERVLFVVTGQEFYHRLRFLERQGEYIRREGYNALKSGDFTTISLYTGVFPGSTMSEVLIRHMAVEGAVENEWWEFRIHGGPILPRLWAWLTRRPYYISPFKVAV